MRVFFDQPNKTMYGTCNRYKNASEILNQAEHTPALKNNLMTKEHIAYCLAWNAIINPNFRPTSTDYNAIGPDLATPLFIFNSTKITGYDFDAPKQEKLNKYLNEWSKVDINPINLPPEDTNKTTDCQLTPKEMFLKDMGDRKRWGYWDVSTISKWSIERCIVIGLKGLGVDPKSVKVGNYKGQTKLIFNWAFPGDVLKERFFLFRKRPFCFCESPASLENFYQKSCDAEGYETATLSIVDSCLKKGGSVILGRTLGNKKEQETALSENSERLGEDFIPLKEPSVFEDLMARKLYNEKDFMAYGWRLYGFRRDWLRSEV